MLIHNTHNKIIQPFCLYIAAINQTVAELKAEGIDCKGYVVDISNRQNVFEAAKQLKIEVGNVDILINNAGIVCCKPLWDLPEKVIESTYNVNILSHYWVNMADRQQLWLLSNRSTRINHTILTFFPLFPSDGLRRQWNLSYPKWWNPIEGTLLQLLQWPVCSAHTAAQTIVPPNLRASASTRHFLPNWKRTATTTFTWHWCVHITLRRACLPALSRGCSQCWPPNMWPTKLRCPFRRTKSTAQCQTVFDYCCRSNGMWIGNTSVICRSIWGFLDSNWGCFIYLQLVASKNVLGDDDSCYQGSTIHDDVQKRPWQCCSRLKPLADLMTS